MYLVPKTLAARCMVNQRVKERRISGATFNCDWIVVSHNNLCNQFYCCDERSPFIHQFFPRSSGWWFRFIIYWVWVDYPIYSRFFSLHFSHYIVNWRRILMDLWLELFRFQFTLFAAQLLMVANETRCSYSISVIKLLFFLLSNKLSPEHKSICRDSQ